MNMESQQHSYNYDYLVLGGGSGGVRFARLMGSKGYKVGLIEGAAMGGTCVLKGCIPKKLFIYAANFKREHENATQYGWSGKLSGLNLNYFMNKKNKELERLSNIYTNLLTNNHVDIIHGWGSFASPNSLKITNNQGETQEYSANKIIVAVGGKTKDLPAKGAEYTIDSEEFLNINYLPERILVIGGGYIALEFASIMLGLGVKVYMAVRNNRILRQFDDDLALHMYAELEKQSVCFIKANGIKHITQQGNIINTTFDSNEIIQTNIVLRATGRLANTNNLNLEVANIKINKEKAILTNQYFQTSNPNVYAIGDVLDKECLTPVATKQAMVLVHNFVNPQQPKIFDHQYIPSSMFCYPELAFCGLTEKQAKDQGYDLDIYKSSFKPLKHTLTDKNIKSFFKIIVDKKTHKVLGIHICDLAAGEIMQGFAVALKKGIIKEELDEVIGIHPTSAEELVTMYHKSS